MKVTASVTNSFNQHDITVATDGWDKKISIASKTTGYGSSVNGGELLLLSLATCFCNDIYREAAGRNIKVEGVKVEFEGEFGGVGDPGSNFRYNVEVQSDAPKPVIDELIGHTDRIAEIHKTLRQGLQIELAK